MADVGRRINDNETNKWKVILEDVDRKLENINDKWFGMRWTST